MNHNIIQELNKIRNKFQNRKEFRKFVATNLNRSERKLLQNIKKYNLYESCCSAATEYRFQRIARTAHNQGSYQKRSKGKRYNVN